MIPENTLTEKPKNKINKVNKIEKMVDREKTFYRTNEYKYSFKNFRTINTFGIDIYNDKITRKEAGKDWSSLLIEIMAFKCEIKSQNPEKKTRRNVFLITYIRSFWKQNISKLKVQVFQT